MKIESQETIQETTGDYLELLERMVIEGKQRYDPTLAIVVSLDALDRLVREARAFRIGVDVTKHEPVATDYASLRCLCGWTNWTTDGESYFDHILGAP